MSIRHPAVTVLLAHIDRVIAVTNAEPVFGATDDATERVASALDQLENAANDIRAMQVAA